MPPLAEWFAAAHQGSGTPWLTPGEAEVLVRFALTQGEGVSMMEAASARFHEPPRDIGWEMIGADDPGENWEDHRDPKRAFAVFRAKLRAAQQAGAHLQYRLWLSPGG